MTDDLLAVLSVLRAIGSCSSLPSTKRSATTNGFARGSIATVRAAYVSRSTMRVRATAYLTKPIDVRQLLELVDQQLAHVGSLSTTGDPTLTRRN